MNREYSRTYGHSRPKAYLNQSEQLSDQISAGGSVHSVESAAIASQVMGNVLKVFVHEGDHVRAGDALVAIDAASLRADVDRAHSAVVAAGGQAVAAESETRMAAATLKRYQDLKDKKSVSPQELEEVETRFHGARPHRMLRRALNTLPSPSRSRSAKAQMRPTSRIVSWLC